MKANRRMVWTVLGVLASLTAEAAPNAVADMVQSPAWIERAGKKLPLAAGMELRNRDRLLTGEGGRVVIRFADTSAVRVGENSLVAVNAMKQRENGIFAGGLDLKSGDLRLISHEYEEAPVSRAINVRFGEVTAAVRGEADLTGTSDEAKDAVALRDGKAVMTHPLAVETTVLGVPLQVYRAAKGKAPEAVSNIDRFDGAIWGLRTQPFYDGGSQEKNGRWMLHFGNFGTEEALTLYYRLRQAGYAARMKPLTAKGSQRYELRLMNLVTEREARALAERLAGNLQLPLAEVTLRR